MTAVNQELLIQHARDFLQDPSLRPHFTELEKSALLPFFTSTDSRVYFIHSLPETVTDVLLSMFSRIKNQRGLRGVFVDSFLPLFLASGLPEIEKEFGGNIEKFLLHYKIDSLYKFISFSQDALGTFVRFQKAISVDPEYIAEFSTAPKVQRFLGMYLDRYGHNSIARMAKLSLCLENVSCLAEKSVEWSRMGIGYTEEGFPYYNSAGYVALSTRYVDMSGKETYPIEKELAHYGVDSDFVRSVIQSSFDYYRTLQGEKFSGLFPDFLREHYRNFSTEKGFESGVVGETCDVLGNFLPCATLTSLGIAASGEAFAGILQHLLLDETTENMAIVELILAEARKIGGDQFSRHFEPTEWKRASWEYLSPHNFGLTPIGRLRASNLTNEILPNNEYAKRILYNGFRKQIGFSNCQNFHSTLELLKQIPHGEFDKLPNHFEKIAADFSGIMSFRSWRDLQRQQLCTHYRTHVTPYLGFYSYDKPAPQKFFSACLDVWLKNVELYHEMKRRSVPPALMQYPLAMGNMIGFDIAANLAEMEFCIWQRSKFSVNHEVRQIFLKMHHALAEQYPWWSDISRAETTPAYIFARTERGIPLVNEL